MQLDYFAPVWEQLDTTRNEVIAVDLPGHGESSAPKVDYTADYFTAAAEQLLEALDLRDVTVVGESIGASIALALGARDNPRVVRLVALNPHDYGRRGGIRRSSTLANVLFTAMLWPGIGSVVARTETGILQRVLQGGLHDPRALPDDLLDELYRCGSWAGPAQLRARNADHYRASSTREASKIGGPGKRGQRRRHGIRRTVCASANLESGSSPGSEEPMGWLGATGGPHPNGVRHVVFLPMRRRSHEADRDFPVQGATGTGDRAGAASAEIAATGKPDAGARGDARPARAH